MQWTVGIRQGRCHKVPFKLSHNTGIYSNGKDIEIIIYNMKRKQVFSVSANYKHFQVKMKIAYQKLFEAISMEDYVTFLL